MRIEDLDTSKYGRYAPHTIEEINQFANFYYPTIQRELDRIMKREETTLAAMVLLSKNTLLQFDEALYNAHQEFINRRSGDIHWDGRRRGGQAERLDPLGEWILQMIASNPFIKFKYLCAELRRQPASLFHFVRSGREEFICFQNWDGKYESVPFSALKHRFSRMKVKYCVAITKWPEYCVAVTEAN